MKATDRNYFFHNTGFRNHILRGWGIALLLAALGGCGSMELKPWVSPYERNNLADPIMSFNRAPVSSAYMHHVHQAREGARGAEGGGGGGCGCN